jgi:polyisoprenyl-phosphate glycosyltransferase
MRQTVSIVIPCYNNAEVLAHTVSDIMDATAQLPYPYVIELVLVDDASQDATWQVISQLRHHPTAKVKGIRLRHNIGAYDAVVAGMQRATGDAIIVMAADGDDPPSLLPEMIGKWADVRLLVQATRTDTGHKTGHILFRRPFYGLLRAYGMRNVPPNGCDYMLADRSVVDRALKAGFRPGHTLIQLYQHARPAVVIPYAKGQHHGPGWTTIKKVELFIFTIISASGAPWSLWMVLPVSILAGCMFIWSEGILMNSLIMLLILASAACLLFIVRYALAHARNQIDVVIEF